MSKYYGHYLNQGALMSGKLLILNSNNSFQEDQFDMGLMDAGIVRYEPFEYDGGVYRLYFTDDYVAINGPDPASVASAFGLNPDLGFDSLDELRRYEKDVAWEAKNNSSSVFAALGALGFFIVILGLGFIVGFAPLIFK